LFSYHLPCHFQAAHAYVSVGWACCHQVAYMTHENAMRYIKFFLSQRNLDRIERVRKLLLQQE